MHILGNFKAEGESRSPYVTVIALDTLTHTPQYALVQESANEIPVVNFGGVFLETRGILSDVSYSNSRGQSGNGIARRSMTINIQTENTKGYPYFNPPLSKRFYYGGQSAQDIYFAVYANDATKQFEPIENSWFLGYYKIESGVSWKEDQGATRISLVQILQKDSTKLGATDEVIPEQFYIFNSWFRGEVIPKVFGYVPRIKMLNAFPSISIKSLSGSISGQVQSNYTNSSPTIILEKFADQSSVLRQLISIGGTVRVRMHDNEVIKGTLSYNAGTGEVTLTVTQRDTYYAKGKGYTYSQGEDYTNWHRLDHQLPLTWSDQATVIIRGKDIIQDPNGFMKANVDAYTHVEPDKKLTADVVVQLTGWNDEKKGIINHEVFFIYDSVVGANANTVLSANFSNVNINTYEPWASNLWPLAPYIWFENFPKPVEFYFNDPTSSSPGSGSIGDAWTVVGVEPTSPDYSVYIRNGFSKFNDTNVYCEGDGRLIKIPDANILSVTQSGTFYGIAGLTKITLSAAPEDMDIGATSNVVYADALYKDGSFEDRSERILYEILKESDLLERYAGPSITGDGYLDDNWLPYCGVLVRETEEVLSVVDRLCYQLGVSLDWINGKYEIRQAAMPFGATTEVEIESQTYLYPNIPYTDATELIENSCEIECGELISVNNAAEDFEYIPLYYDVEYGSWEDPFFKLVKPATNRAIGQNSFKFSYKFDMINDANSFNFAVTSSLSIGHPSGLYSVERYLKAKMTIDGCRWAAMDPIVFRDFPLISTEDETDAVIADDGQPQYLKHDAGHSIMGAVCCVESMEVAFGVDQAIEVNISARMSQVAVNAKGVNIYNAPYPPLPPNDPPSDPTVPPNIGGGTDTGPGIGGSYSPMRILLSDPAAIVIDSTDDETSAFTIDIAYEELRSAGWRYSAYVQAEDGSAFDPAGAFLTGDISSAYPDKNNSADETPINYPTKNLTLNVNYQWFMDVGPTIVSRPLKIVIRREIYFTRTGVDFYVDFTYKTVQVTITDPRDIIPS